MATILERDGRNECFLTEGSLPSFKRVMQARPKHFPNEAVNKAKGLQSPDNAAVWLYATLAKRMANGRGERDYQEIQAWILEPSQNGRLAKWFEGQGQTYRLFVLRQRDLPGKGSSFGSIDNRIGLVHRTGKYSRLLPAGRQFLKEVVEAYSQGVEVVHNLMKESNHPYLFSEEVF